MASQKRFFRFGKSLAVTVFFLFCLCAILWQAPLALATGGNHTITIDGTNDFSADEDVPGTSGSTWYFTWDANNFYFAVAASDVAANSATKWVWLYLDTDPRQNPLAGNGSSTGVNYNTQTPGLPFRADYHFRWKSDNSYTNMLDWNSGTSSWTDDNTSGGNFGIVAFQSGTFVEFKIPRTSLGSPTQVYVCGAMINEQGGVESTFFMAPQSNGPDGYDKDFAHYFGFPLVDNIAPDFSGNEDTYPVASIATGNYSTGATWTGGVAPHNNSNVFIQNGHTVTLDATGDAKHLTIISGGTFTGSSNTLNIASNGLLTNNGTFNAGTSTVLFGGAGTVAGTIAFNNVTIANGVNCGSAATINGILQINTGGFVNTNAPTYGSAATLLYNTGGSYNASAEWTANAGTGAGVPQNVQLSNGTTLNLSTPNRTANGNLTIDTGSTLTSTSGVLTLGGNFTNNGTFTHNSGNVTFNGTGTKSVSGSAATTAFNTLTVNMGSSASVLDVLSPITMATDGLTLTQGTFKLSSASTITPFAGATTIPANAGFHLNHASAVSNWGSTGSLTLDGTLTIDNGTMTVGSASGNQLTLGSSTSKATINNGTLNLAGRVRVVSSGAGNGLFINGGEMVVTTVGNSSSSDPNFNIGATGNFTMTNGTVTFERANGNVSGGELVIASGSGTKSITGGTMRVGNAATPAGQTIELNSAAPIFHLLVNSANATAQLASALDVNGDLTVSAGALNANNLNLNLAGNWTNNGTFTPGTGTVTLDGASGQTMSGSTFYNLAINNASGVTLLTDETVSNTLSLLNGNVHTGSNKMIIAAGGNVARTSGHIVGNLQKNFATGANVARTFEIGDASNYTPVEVAIASVSSAGNLTAKTAAGDHASIGTSTLDASKSVNRNWTLTSDGVLAFTNFDATFNFVAADLDGGANTNNLSVGKLDGGTWTYPTVGTRTATSTQATGMASFSDFQLAESSTPPGVTITESSSSTDVTEGGATDTYTLVLNTQPSADVTIAFNTGTQLQAITSITFTSANWNTPQTITVTANDDNNVEGAHNGTITHSATSSDANYNGIAIANVTANITDNDIAGVTITESSSSTDVTEGGATDTYTIVLNTQPSADVTIAFNTGAQLQAITSITFTSANWNTPQTITVTANDDNAVEGAHTGTITHSATSSDANYNGIAIANVTANITDNDIAGVTITESSGSTDVTEGGATDTYTLVLNTQPSADVTIAFNTGTQLQAISAITFTSLNWNIAQTVTVTANDDNVVEGSHTGTITHSATSSDANYNGIAIANVTANITDNDIAGVTITESSSSTDVTEGGATDTYTLVLNTQPSADVTIAFNTGTQLQAISAITFTSLNWNIAQTVTVTANDDNVVEGSHTGTITHSATSSDANYNGIAIANVTANITDNDIAGVTITESSGSTDVTEGGATDSYTVVLNTQPSADVTIAFNTGSQLQAITSITFTSTNWNTPQTITVTANDDNVVEGSHTGTITHSATSSDANYNGIAIANVTANITDNDIAGVTITESSGSTDVTEGGATDTYTIVLNTQPSADVTIAFNTGSQLQAITSITFTSANWNVAQTITVTANDDNNVEGAHNGTITHSATSSDANYNGIAIANVTANITDNDIAPPPPTVKPFVLLANKVTLKSTKQSTPSGDIHSNGTLVVEKGKPSTYNSNLTAVGKITINKQNTINGNVKSQTSISNSGTINGTKTIGPVANEPLPSLSYSAGGPNKTVPNGGSLTLAPGSYGIVTMSQGGTLKLTSGEYFMNELRYASTIEAGTIEIDLSSGDPVTINVVSNLQLGHEAAIVLLPNGEGDSELVTFNTMQSAAVNWGREAYLLGSFNAPNAIVTLVKNSQLRGTICAKEILVSNDCLFLHHNSPGSLPGPGNLPKAASDKEEKDSEQSTVTSYQLEQNYPNPFNPSTTISFALPQASEVTLSIFNTSGQLVKKLVAGEMNAGTHSFTWDATNEHGEHVASGVYLYVIKAGEFTAQRKLLLMK